LTVPNARSHAIASLFKVTIQAERFDVWLTPQMTVFAAPAAARTKAECRSMAGDRAALNGGGSHLRGRHLERAGSRRRTPAGG
jgi:hypothetical protein